MVLVTSNTSRRLLCVSYIGHVQAEEFHCESVDFVTQLAEFKPGFRLLADFSQLETMDAECVPELGRVMELIGHAGVSVVVRVIPDPSKDIGLNILAAFHYLKPPQVVTCENMTQAVRALDL